MTEQRRHIEPHHLSGLAALSAARNTYMCKMKGEKDTAFVRRIVCAYLNAHVSLHRDATEVPWDLQTR